MSALESRLLQFGILAPPAVFLGWWAWQCARVWVQRARFAEELAARRVCCHVCGTRVYVGETAHDAEPADDGAERFACAEHCEVCR